MSQPPTRRSVLGASTAATVGLMFKSAISQSQDLAGMTLQQARQLLRSKAVSPVDLPRACLTRIERYNSKLDAFITVIGERALADARAMEAEQAKGKWRGPLHGIPIIWIAYDHGAVRLLHGWIADRSSDHRRSIR